jgi:hypothetical protein
MPISSYPDPTQPGPEGLETRPHPGQSVVGRLVLNVIDHENRHRVFLQFHFQPELSVDRFRKRNGASRIRSTIPEKMKTEAARFNA